ncbi:hypothetical protein [Pedosphaera parvula]|uniref:Uncharacterized protein n=1 Tax=Pedosphaera parvula (strain Ellin514) TaxID=320771 RepID=B9XRP6_PEDPL|nr:hypothetical protein [Pedosphaera parvula]EEF57461.1 hypothetical protein Cflav_PD0495 [Pedosphaera parvula Ellin514]
MKLKGLFLILLCLLVSSAGNNLLIADSNTPSPTTLTTPDKTKPCFNCKGTGLAKCPVATCKDGQMDCPGPCLKLSKGIWRHMPVEGHPATDLWQTFPTSTGTTSWNQHHVGEVIQMQNGEPVNIGACKVCGGTTRVKCTTCKGTGQTTCNICEGKKFVPETWSSFDNPKLKKRPNLIHLKDGKTIVGRIIMSGGSKTRIKTEQGDIDLPATDVLSEETQKSQ